MKPINRIIESSEKRCDARGAGDGVPPLFLQLNPVGFGCPIGKFDQLDALVLVSASATDPHNHACSGILSLVFFKSD